MFSGMGLGSSIKKAWNAASKKTRAISAAGILGAASLLATAIYVLGADFIIGVINDKIVEIVGPLAPAVGQVIAAYFFSFATACGVIWFAASWGYWLANRYPIPIPATPIQPKQNEDTVKRREALSAIREIIEKFANIERIVEKSYGDAQQTRDKWLNKYRPEIQANIRVLAHSGFVTPPADTMDSWEADGLLGYAKEIEPFLAKDALFSEARERAARFTIEIEKIIAERRPKT